MMTSTLARDGAGESPPANASPAMAAREIHPSCRHSRCAACSGRRASARNLTLRATVARATYAVGTHRCARRPHTSRRPAVATAATRRSAARTAAGRDTSRGYRAARAPARRTPGRCRSRLSVCERGGYLGGDRVVDHLEHDGERAGLFNGARIGEQLVAHVLQPKSLAQRRGLRTHADMPDDGDAGAHDRAVRAAAEPLTPTSRWRRRCS